jgi:hypothetical protein
MKPLVYMSATGAGGYPYYSCNLLWKPGNKKQIAETQDKVWTPLWRDSYKKENCHSSAGGW